MPKSKKQSKRAGRKNPAPRRAPNPGRRQGKSRGSVARLSGQLSLMRMLSDPCSAPLVGGQYGDIQGEMLRVMDTFKGSAANTSGYIVWFPQFHTDGNSGNATGERKTNCFFLNTTAAGSSPTNSAAAPFGGNAGTSLRDPAFNWVTSNNIADARTAAACLQMRYTGSTMNCAGTFSKLTNIPHDLFRSGTMPSVDQLTAYSRDIERIGFEVMEVIHRPDVQANIFFADNDGPYSYNLGTSATVPTTVSTANNPRGFGFAWAGVDVNTNLFFSRYKVIEWRPFYGAGMPAPRITAVGVPPVYLAEATLDAKSRSEGSEWTNGKHFMEAAGKMGGSLLRGVVQGVFAPGAGVRFPYNSGLPSLRY